MNDTHSRLKKLQVRKTRVQSKIKRDGSNKCFFSEITSINKEIEKLKRQTKVLISEHALLRYLERIRGVDLEAIKAEMLTKDAKGFLEQFSTCSLPVENGTGRFRLKVVDHVVVTVMTMKECA